MTEKIDLYENCSGNHYFVGCVELPGLTTREEAAEKLKLCWAEWQEGETDSDFIDWLVKTHGWTKAEGNFRVDLD